MGKEKYESRKCSVAKCVLYVLLSRKLLTMSSKWFYAAEEVEATLVADVLWHENGSDVSDDSSSESDREEFGINELILTVQVANLEELLKY